MLRRIRGRRADLPAPAALHNLSFLTAIPRNTRADNQAIMLTTEIPPGVRAEELAAICGVSIRTARRWIANGLMPSGLALGFRLLKHGDLGHLHRAWNGWRLIDDKL